MTLPIWAQKWLEAYGVNVAAFETEVLARMDKLDAPEEWKAQISAWLSANAAISSDALLAFVALAYAELRSGAPGYNKDHGGLA